MSNSDSDIGASLSLDISQYEKSINRAVRDASQFEGALDDLTATINKTDKALSSLDTDIKLSVEADTSAIGGLQADLDKLDAKLTPLVDVDTGNLNAVKGDLAAALDSSFTTKLNIDDTELTPVKRKIEDLGTTENVKIDVTGDPANDPDVVEIKSALQDLRQLAVIEMALNFAGQIPTPADVPILGAIVESANAAKQLEASLGAGFRPEQAQLSTDVYTSNLAGSREEAAAKVATTMQMIGNEAGTATTTSENLFSTIERGTYTAQLMGAEYEEVLRSTKILVDNGLVPSFEAGFDLLVTAQQEGVAASGDLLDSINEYVPQLKLMGFTAEESMNIFNTALDEGVLNLDKVSDLIKETNIRIQEGIADAESTPGKVIDKLGLADEAAAYAAGEISGASFMQGLSVAAKAGLEAGTITQQDLFDLLGSPGEDLTIPVALEILGTGGAGVFGDTAGAADQVGALLGTSIENSIITAQRLIETELAASISDAWDIPGKIEAFNAGISEFAELVKGGESITGAIEKAFDIPGLEDTVNRLESTIGNLVIELASIGANIVEGLGNKSAADDIRAGVAQMAEQQLTFDLMLARDGEDVTNSVSTAIRRGVESDDVRTALAAAGGEFLATGDLQGLQAYVATLESLTDVAVPQPVLDLLAGRGIDITNLQAVNAELKEIQAGASTGVANADWNAVQMLQSQGINLNEVVTNLDYAGAAQQIAGDLATDLDSALFTKFNELFSGGQFLEGFITAIGHGEADTAGIFGSEMLSQLSDLPNQLFSGLADLGGEIPFLTNVEMKLDTTAAKVSEVMPVIGETIQTGGTMAFEAFTAGINEAGNAMLAQVPIIGEQAGQMQSDMEATSEGTDLLSLAVEALNTISLTPLGGQFAGLRSSAEDQIGYINLQLDSLMGKLQGLAGFSIDIPGVAGRSGGAHMYGGVIPSGTVGTVHGNEMFMAAPQGTDISVLNSQTTSVLEAAIASMVGGGAGGGSVSNVTYNNNFIYNVQSNAQGFMSEGAARSARGF